MTDHNSDNRTVEQLISQVEAQKMRVKVEQQQLERHEQALAAKLKELGLRREGSMEMDYLQPEPEPLEDRLDNLLKKANFEN